MVPINIAHKILTFSMPLIIHLMNHYHNTNKESGSTLAESEAKAMKQEDRVLELLKGFKIWLTPEEVHQLTGMKQQGIPITSARRALSNLKRAGKVVKSMEAYREGDHGKRVHTWTTKENADKNLLTVQDMAQMDLESYRL